MAALPEDARPSANDEGMQRHARLQLKMHPPHDFSADRCNPMSKEDEEELVELAKQRELVQGTGSVMAGPSGKVSCFVLLFEASGTRFGVVISLFKWILSCS